MNNQYNPSEHPQGVPSPFVPRVHPYPSYAQGPDYTRAVFAMPFEPRPFNVMDGLGQQSPVAKIVPRPASAPDAPVEYQFSANFRSDDEQYGRCLFDLGLKEGPAGVLLEGGVPAGPESYLDAYMCASYYQGQKSGYRYGLGIGAVTGAVVAIALGALWRRKRKR